MTQRYYQHGNAGTYVLELKGSLVRNDSVSLDSLATTRTEITDKKDLKRLIIHQVDSDLKIDSAGMGLLASLTKMLNNGEKKARTDFAGLNGKFKTLFDRCGFDTVFRTYDNLEKALKSE